MSADVRPELAPWLGPDEQVVWFDRPRPRFLDWPPRSALALTAWLVFVLLVSFGGLEATLHWREATQVSFRRGASPIPCLAFLLPCLLVALLYAVGSDALTADTRRYALTRHAPSGDLLGYSCSDQGAIRFLVAGPPLLVTRGRRGEVDWGELEVELLPARQRERVLVRWTEVRDVDRVVELISRA